MQSLSLLYLLFNIQSLNIRNDYFPTEVDRAPSEYSIISLVDKMRWDKVVKQHVYRYEYNLKYSSQKESNYGRGKREKNMSDLSRFARIGTYYGKNYFYKENLSYFAHTRYHCYVSGLRNELLLIETCTIEHNTLYEFIIVRL